MPERTDAHGVTLSTYLAPVEAQLLRDRAAAADRSIAAELRRIIRHYLAADLTNDDGPARQPTRVPTSASGDGRCAGA